MVVMAWYHSGGTIIKPSTCPYRVISGVISDVASNLSLTHLLTQAISASDTGEFQMVFMETVDT